MNLYEVLFTIEIARCNGCYIASWACEVTEILTQRSIEEASIV